MSTRKKIQRKDKRQRATKRDDENDNVFGVGGEKKKNEISS